MIYFLHHFQKHDISRNVIHLVWLYIFIIIWTVVISMPQPPAGATGAPGNSTGGNDTGTGGNDTVTAEGEGGDNATAEEKVEIAQLTMPPDAVTPINVFTDRYGEPVVGSKILNFTLLNGATVQIYTEEWKTYFTYPATKPGCLCVTRGPLTKFKLIGNIHFPKIKVTPPRYVTPPTEEVSTLCPPCPSCPTCPR